MGREARDQHCSAGAVGAVVVTAGTVGVDSAGTAGCGGGTEANLSVLESEGQRTDQQKSNMGKRNVGVKGRTASSPPSLSSPPSPAQPISTQLRACPMNSNRS